MKLVDDDVIKLMRMMMKKEVVDDKD